MFFQYDVVQYGANLMQYYPEKCGDKWNMKSCIELADI